jgi:hypothetical protein
MLASIVSMAMAWTGLAGVLERLAAPRMLRQIYRDELARLDQVAGSIK